MNWVGSISPAVESLQVGQENFQNLLLYFWVWCQQDNQGQYGVPLESWEDSKSWNWNKNSEYLFLD